MCGHCLGDLGGPCIRKWALNASLGSEGRLEVVESRCCLLETPSGFLHLATHCEHRLWSLLEMQIPGFFLRSKIQIFKESCAHGSLKTTDFKNWKVPDPNPEHA